MTLQKVIYSLTNDDVNNNGYAAIPVLWKTPLNGNYVITYEMENPNPISANWWFNYLKGPITLVSSAGFTAVIYTWSANVGDLVIIHAVGQEY